MILDKYKGKSSNVEMSLSFPEERKLLESCAFVCFTPSTILKRPSLQGQIVSLCVELENRIGMRRDFLWQHQ